MRGSSFNGRGAVRAALRGCLPCTAALLAAVLVFAGPGRAQQVRPLHGSEVVLQGRTTVGPWRCTIVGVVADLGTANLLEDAVVRLPLNGVECGSRGMEADLRAALRADRHPNIVLRSLRVGDSDPGVATVSGGLEVGGLERSISTSVRWLAADGRLRLTGALPLRMTDFDVEPPRAMLGLIRARNEVVVEYDVTVRIPERAAVAELVVIPLQPGGRP